MAGEHRRKGVEYSRNSFCGSYNDGCVGSCINYGVKETVTDSQTDWRVVGRRALRPFDDDVSARFCDRSHTQNMYKNSAAAVDVVVVYYRAPARRAAICLEKNIIIF